MKAVIKKISLILGCDVEPYCAIVHMSDGTVATDKSYRNMDWKIERYDNVRKTYTIVKIQEGESIDFWMPYGTMPGQYKITATSKIEPDVSGYTWEQLYYPWYYETFCICEPGKIKYGKISGKRPGAKDIRYTEPRKRTVNTNLSEPKKINGRLLGQIKILNPEKHTITELRLTKNLRKESFRKKSAWAMASKKFPKIKSKKCKTQ